MVYCLMTQMSHMNKENVQFVCEVEALAAIYLVCGFSNIPQGTYEHGRFLGDMDYSLWSLYQK